MGNNKQFSGMTMARFTMHPAARRQKNGTAGAKAAACRNARRAALSSAAAVALTAAWLTAPTPAAATNVGDAPQSGAPANSDQRAQAQTAQAFDIGPQALSSALTEFGRQSGYQVSVDHGTLAGLGSEGVRGTMSPEQALRRLLNGSGITWRFTGDRSVVLTRAATGDSGAMTLDPITVEGQSVPRQAVIGNLPPAYAGGQVARGGNLGLLGNKDMMDTPFNQTNYTSELIRNQQDLTLGDVLMNDPSVVKTFDRGTGIDSWNVRGLGGDNRVVGFDGLFGVAPTFSDIMASEAIERVEVLKGPSALINGVNPTAVSANGFVNIVPKRAGDAPMLDVTADYAMDSRFGGHVDAGRRFGKKNAFGARFNGVYRNGDTPVDDQSWETRLAALGLDYRGDTVRLSSDLGYQFQHTDAQRRPVSLATGVPVPDAPDNRLNYAQPWMFYERVTYYGALRGEWDILDNLTAFAGLGGGLQENTSKQNNPILQDAAGTLTGNPIAVAGFTNTGTGEAGLRGDVVTGPVHHDLVLSGAWSLQETGFGTSAAALPASNLFNPIDYPEPAFADLPDPEDVPLSNRYENIGSALADTLSILNERVQLVLGLRWQRIKQKAFATDTSYDENALTPAVGVVVKPWEKVSLYANYIEGLERGSTAPDTAANAGEAFPPTKTKQYEVGAKLDTGRIAATIAAFTTTRPNAFTDADTNIFQQDGENRYRGIEFTTFGSPVDGVRFLGGITYLDAQQVETSGGTNDGNRTTGTPELRASLTGEWDTPFLRGLTLSATGQWQTSTFEDSENTQKVDGWYRFDLGARYVIEPSDWKPITIRAHLRNVLDSDYWATSDNRLGLSEPRTFLISAIARF